MFGKKKNSINKVVVSSKEELKTAGGKRHKISPIIETHQEALSEKTERSKGLPS